jgi:TonB family protein
MPQKSSGVVLTSCLILLLETSVPATAQSPVHVEAADAQKHLAARVDPVYPAIAKAARVEGQVEVAIEIGSDGKVTSEKAVSGPPMLQQSALDAIKKWQFKPFEIRGTATSVSTTLTVPFSLDKQKDGPTENQEKAAQAWFPLFNKCRSALKEQNTQDALDHCKEALDTAVQTGDLTPSDQLALLDSHQSYGHALLAAGRLQEALIEEDKAVEVARTHLKETDQEYAMPFYWRAVAEARLGQGEAASADLTVAEETHRRAIAHLPEMTKVYSQYLASILKQHATLLDEIGKPEEAAKLRAEASSL